MLGRPTVLAFTWDLAGMFDYSRRAVGHDRPLLLMSLSALPWDSRRLAWNSSL